MRTNSELSTAQLLKTINWNIENETAESFIDKLHAGQVSAQNLSDSNSMAQNDDLLIVAHQMDFPIPMHTHDYVEVIFTSGGRLINRVDQEDLYMLDGSVCVMNRSSSHELCPVDPDTVIVNLCLRPSFFSSGPAKKLLAEETPLVKLLREPELQNHIFYPSTTESMSMFYLHRLFEAYAKAGGRENAEVESLATLALCELGSLRGYTFRGINQTIMKMLEWLENHPEEASVRRMAEVFGYSENYLTQYFKRHSGRTASSFITEAKLARALELLRETDLSVEAVAHKAGYRSYSHFSQIFHKRFGITPATYRG